MTTNRTSTLAVPADTAAATTPLALSRISGITDPPTHISLLCVMAREAHVIVSDGTVFQGVFGGTELNSGEVYLVLRYARVVVGDVSKLDSAAERRGNFATRLCIPVSTLVRMDSGPIPSCTPALGTRFGDILHRANDPRQESNRFATDKEITAQATHEPLRELRKFNDFVELEGTGNLDLETFGDLSLDSRAEKWDQFQANLPHFDVETSFDESEYTTKIDLSNPDFLEREREAERLAMEIEKKSSTNSHVQEERNQMFCSQHDEEEQYSAVLLPGTRKSEALIVSSSFKHLSTAKSENKSAKFGQRSSKLEFAHMKMKAPKTAGKKQNSLLEKPNVTPTTAWSGPPKQMHGKVGPSPRTGVNMKSGPAVHMACRDQRNSSLGKQNAKLSHAPPPLKAQLRRKMTYAAVVGAKRIDRASSPTAVVPAAVMAAPCVPLSPVSPSNRIMDFESAPALPGAPCTSSNALDTRQSVCVSNDDSGFPNHRRNSGVQPRIQQSGFVNGYSPGTRPHSTGKAEKKKKRRSSSRNKPTADNGDFGTSVSQKTPDSTRAPCTKRNSMSRQCHRQKSALHQENMSDLKGLVHKVAADSAAASPQTTSEVPKELVRAVEVELSDESSAANETHNLHKSKTGKSLQLLGNDSEGSSAGNAPSNKSERQRQNDGTNSGSTLSSVAKDNNVPRRESTTTNRRIPNVAQKATVPTKKESMNVLEAADAALSTNGEQRLSISKNETSAHQSENRTMGNSNGLSSQMASYGPQQKAGTSAGRDRRSKVEDTQVPARESTTTSRRKSSTAREMPKMPVKKEVSKSPESSDGLLCASDKKGSCKTKVENGAQHTANKAEGFSIGMPFMTASDGRQQNSKLSVPPNWSSGVEDSEELQQGLAAASQTDFKTVRKLPGVQVTVTEDADGGILSDLVLNTNRADLSRKAKGETRAQGRHKESEGNSNGMSTPTNSDGEQQVVEKCPRTVGLSTAEDVYDAQRRPDIACRRKRKTKLNPNASAWVPSPSVVPVGATSAHAAPLTPMGQAYPKGMVNCPAMSSGMLEHHQTSGMVYAMTPTLATCPSYGHVASYPVMMPGILPQSSHVPGYAYVPHNTGVAPGGGQNSTMMGAARGMVVANAESAAWQFFNGRQYLPMQSPMYQQEMAPAYLPGGGQQTAAASSDGRLQKHGIVNRHRSRGNGRGRQHRGHHQIHRQGQYAYSDACMTNSSRRNDGKQHGLYGKQRHWYPVVRGNAEKIEGAIEGQSNGDKEHGGVRTTKAQEQ